MACLVPAITLDSALSTYVCRCTWITSEMLLAFHYGLGRLERVDFRQCFTLRPRLPSTGAQVSHGRHVGMAPHKDYLR